VVVGAVDKWITCEGPHLCQGRSDKANGWGVLERLFIYSLCKTLGEKIMAFWKHKDLFLSIFSKSRFWFDIKLKARYGGIKTEQLSDFSTV
jgi:hypothetical protein